MARVQVDRRDREYLLAQPELRECVDGISAPRRLHGQHAFQRYPRIRASRPRSFVQVSCRDLEMRNFLELDWSSNPGQQGRAVPDLGGGVEDESHAVCSIIVSRFYDNFFANALSCTPVGVDR